MKRIYAHLALCSLVVLLIACATSYRMALPAAMQHDTLAGAEEVNIQSNRMMVWAASLTIEVESVSNAVQQANDIVNNIGGYVQQSSDAGEAYAMLTLRVPANALNSTIELLESLGTVKERHLSSEDVTERYIDVEARVKNKIALRDRLRDLLEKATDVKDILAIETELSRVQADIDSMQARLKSLKGLADLATIDVIIKRKRVLGPISYLLKGIWWGVEKLFVIQK